MLLRSTRLRLVALMLAVVIPMSSVGLSMTAAAQSVGSPASESLFPASAQAGVLSEPELEKAEGEFLTYLVVRCVFSAACRSGVRIGARWAWGFFSAWSMADWARNKW